MSSRVRSFHSVKRQITNQIEGNAYEIIKDPHTLIVSFAGNGLENMNNIPIFEFKNFLTATFPSSSLLFLKDSNTAWYNKGIKDISSDIPSTVEYLRKKISMFKKIIFIGSSSGGYAAILFGSLLNVNMVIAFRPQTKVVGAFIDNRYTDLRKYINSTTLYHIYGETCKPAGDLHSIEHCENISMNPNVNLTKKEVLNLKELRDNGWLKNEFEQLFSTV